MTGFPLDDETKDFIKSAEILAEPYRDEIARLTTEVETLRQMLQFAQRDAGDADELRAQVRSLRGVVQAVEAERDQWRETSAGNARTSALLSQNCAKLMRERDEARAALTAAADAPQPEPESLQRRLFAECETAGWDPEKRNSFAEECAHLHEEVSEAFREWRLHKDFETRYEPSGKPTGIPIELADVLIGLFYNAELHGFDLLEAVENKHLWNLTRSYQAEGRTLHPPGPSPAVLPESHETKDQR